MLTVVMTTRDRAERLARSLDAWESLEPPRGGYRLVVADDGSRDATPDVLAARAGRLPLVARRGPPRGQNAARNAALAGVEGDLVVFTDDDALPRPDWLVRLREAADERPEADVIVGTVVPRFEAAPPPWVLRAVRRGPSFAWIERPEAGWVDPTEGLGPALAVRAAHFARGLRFDESVGPDGSLHYAMGSETELLLRLRAAGARAWYARDAVVEHVVTAAQVEEPALVARAYRYGRGRRRVGSSHYDRARAALFGVPVALAADLASRRVGYARARRRAAPGGLLRAACRLAFLAGHLAEVRRERGRSGLGLLGALEPEAVLDAIGRAPPPPAGAAGSPRARPALAEEAR